MGSLELLFDYLEDHVHAAALIDERKPVAFGLFCYLFGGASLYVAQALAQRLFILPYSWSSCVFALLWEAGAGFLLAATLHLILEMTGAKGSAAGLFVQLGLADLSWALAVPLVLLASAFFRHSSLAVAGAFFVVGLLNLSLKARGIKDNYRISLARSWFVLGLPYAAAATAAVLAASAAIIGLIVELVRLAR